MQEFDFIFEDYYLYFSGDLSLYLSIIYKLFLNKN